MARAHKVPGLRRDGTLQQNAQRIAIVRIAEWYDFVPFIHDPATDRGAP